MQISFSRPQIRLGRALILRYRNIYKSLSMSPGSLSPTPVSHVTPKPECRRPSVYKVFHKHALSSSSLRPAKVLAPAVLCLWRVSDAEVRSGNPPRVQILTFRNPRVRCDLKDLPLDQAGPCPSCSNCKERGLKCVYVPLLFHIHYHTNIPRAETNSPT